MLKSFFSASPPCCLPSSRRKSRPGPQVGRADREHTIFPPVFSKAAKAAFNVGRSAGSGFLTWENNAGSWLSNDVIFDLFFCKQKSLNGDDKLTLPRRDLQTGRHSGEQMDPQDLA